MRFRRSTVSAPFRGALLPGSRRALAPVADRLLATARAPFQLSNARATDVSPEAATRMTTSPNPEAAFVGKITAAATHEIRNALAIIKESAGLIDDLMRMSNPGGAIDRERVFQALGRIEAQVGRGADIATHLNRVAHAPDHDLETVDLEKEVRQVVFHAQRAARRKSQAVTAGPATRPCPPLRARPLHVQMALYATVETCLERLAEGAEVEVRAGMRDDRPAVRVTSSTPGVLAWDPASWNGLEELLNRLGVSLESPEAGNGLTLLFASPE